MNIVQHILAQQMAFLLASSSTDRTSSSSHLLLLRLPKPAPSRRTMAFIVCGSVRDPNEDRKFWGRKVDKHMHVLRSRIYKKRIEEEASYKDSDADPLRELAEDWMEWERRYYETRYVADVSRLVGFLQTFLLNTRPSVAVTLSVLAVAGLPALAVVGVVHLVEFLKIILSGVCAT